MQTRLGMQENIAFWLWNQHASSKCLQFGPQHYFFLLVYFSENYLKLSIFPFFHTPSISFLQGILACGKTSISFLQGVLACGKIEACFDIDLLQHVMSCYKINVVSKDFWNTDVLIYFSYTKHAIVSQIFWSLTSSNPNTSYKRKRREYYKSFCTGKQLLILGILGSFFEGKWQELCFSIERGRRL
jgi:hypothetical protein